MNFFVKYLKTPLGTMAIVADESIIRKSYLPEKTEIHLIKKVEAEFPNISSKNIPEWLNDLEEDVKSYFKTGKSIPPTVEKYFDWNQFSDFQKKVLKNTFKIPHGKTLHYGDLAHNIKSPKASRAVGTALAKNPLPLLIPCHRVLPKQNGMGGFSAFGGNKTKAYLLNLESKKV
jgi:methylated-DNA-[protein]-cysteine S-methyltransferase